MVGAGCSDQLFRESIVLPREVKQLVPTHHVLFISGAGAHLCGKVAVVLGAREIVFQGFPLKPAARSVCIGKGLKKGGVHRRLYYHSRFSDAAGLAAWTPTSLSFHLLC